MPPLHTPESDDPDDPIDERQFVNFPPPECQPRYPDLGYAMALLHARTTLDALQAEAMEAGQLRQALRADLALRAVDLLLLAERRYDGEGRWALAWRVVRLVFRAGLALGRVVGSAG